MNEHIQVQCSGAFYASLHCEIINNAGIQEGFLKGEIEKHTSFDINDLDLNSKNAIVKINISGYIPCASVGSFYNGCGKINPLYIEHLIDSKEEIIGWYRCRRCTNGSFLKEIKIHEQLQELFSSKGKYFLFSLFSKNDEMSTCTMDVSYKFQVMQNGGEFTNVPLNMINLNNTSASGYIKAASSTLYNSEALENILIKIQNLEPGVKEVNSIHKGLIHQVQLLLPKFSAIQEQYHLTLQRVNHLREYCHNYELKFGKEDEVIGTSEGKTACVKNERNSQSEKEVDVKFKSTPEKKKVVRLIGSEAFSPENKKITIEEKAKKDLRFSNSETEKKALKGTSAEKVNFESSSINGKKKACNKKKVICDLEEESLEEVETRGISDDKMCSDSPEF